MIRTGVIGYGLGGMAFHAPLVSAVPELELAGIATSRAALVHERYPGMATPSAEAMIADPSIELIVISTPNDSHFPLAHAALNAGKHVVIDKPFTITVADGEALLALAKEKGRVLSAFHNRRWDGDFLTVQNLLAEGRLGDVRLAEFRWDRFRPEVTALWRDQPDAGSGMLADLGPHLIDQALVLWGMPDAIQADIAVQRDNAVTDDYFVVTLHYGRRRVVCSASRLIVSPSPRFAMHGTQANFIKYGLDPQEPMMKAGGRADDPSYGIEDAANYGVLTLPDGSQERIPTVRGDYKRYYAGVARAIETGTPPPVTAEDAVIGLRLMDLARQSSREGRRISL